MSWKILEIPVRNLLKEVYYIEQLAVLNLQ